MGTIKYMSGPLVSICIPTYNGAAYILEAVESAFAQDYDNLEIIVSDDASKDNTLDLIQSIDNAREIPLKIFNHNPKGIGANWNNCITNASGKYIKFLLQDDIIFPNCISKMVELAERDNDVGLIYCKRKIIFDLDKKYDRNWVKRFGTLHQHWSNLKINEGILDGKTYLKNENFLELPFNKIGEPTCVLLSKKCVDENGYFNVTMKQALDIDYWYRSMRYTKVGFLDEKLVAFRLHENQASQKNMIYEVEMKEIKLLYKSYYRNLFYFLSDKNKIRLLKLSFRGYPLGRNIRLAIIKFRVFIRL